MFVPVYDDNPLRSIKFQFVTFGLIALNLVVFAFEISGVQPIVLAGFGVVPLKLFGASLSGTPGVMPVQFAELPAWATLVTYMFFHGDIWHVFRTHAAMIVYGVELLTVRGTP